MRFSIDESFKKEFLETHNEYRRKHQAPDLILSDTLCASAQLWADQILSENCMKHSDTDNGENIYHAWSSQPKKLTGKLIMNTIVYNPNEFNDILPLSELNVNRNKAPSAWHSFHNIYCVAFFQVKSL